MDEFTPEQLQALIELGIMPEELAGLDEQLAQADALRGTPMPEGQMAGRVFVAPNPLQYLAAGMDRYRGARDAKELRGQRKELLGKTTNSRMAYAQALMDALRGGGGAQAPAQPMQPQQPPSAMPPGM